MLGWEGGMLRVGGGEEDAKSRGEGEGDAKMGERGGILRGEKKGGC